MLVDTDVILIGQFYSFCELNPRADIWVAFGIGKQFCYCHINVRCEELGRYKSMSFPSFHAFTGCDSTSSFFGKSKKSAWATWVSYPDATEAFLHFATHPHEPIDCTSLSWRALQ